MFYYKSHSLKQMLKLQNIQRLFSIEFNGLYESQYKCDNFF